MEKDDQKRLSGRLRSVRSVVCGCNTEILGHLVACLFFPTAVFFSPLGGEKKDRVFPFSEKMGRAKGDFLGAICSTRRALFNGP